MITSNNVGAGSTFVVTETLLYIILPKWLCDRQKSTVQSEYPKHAPGKLLVHFVFRRAHSIWPNKAVSNNFGNSPIAMHI